MARLCSFLFFFFYLGRSIMPVVLEGACYMHTKCPKCIPFNNFSNLTRLHFCHSNGTSITIQLDYNDQWWIRNLISKKGQGNVGFATNQSWCVTKILLYWVLNWNKLIPTASWSKSSSYFFCSILFVNYSILECLKAKTLSI